MAVSNQIVPPSSLTDVHDCNSSVEVEDLVYIDSLGILRKAKADDPSTMPAIGIVSQKISPTKCFIAKSFTALTYTGVTPRDVFFVSETNAGEVQDTVPSTPGRVWQNVGMGLNSNKIHISVDLTGVILL